MNCENCGAPTQPVQEKGYFFCTYCGSFQFPSATPEGIRVLEESPELITCPVCWSTLYRASIDGWPVLHCTNCRGFLSAQSIFINILNYRRANAAGPPGKPKPLNRQDLFREIYCPSCKQRMDTHPYYGPGNFVIDVCLHCGILWLDHGELHQATDAPGRDRGLALKLDWEAQAG